MTQRTTINEVQDVLTAGGDYDTLNSPSLQPYLDAATVMVDRVVSMATLKSVTLSTAEQEIIERWVAAHCYCCSDQPYSSKSTSGASGSFQGQTQTGLDGTKYGQMALRLDYSGCLEQLDKKKRARLTWLGKPVSSQTPYDQRS